MRDASKMSVSTEDVIYAAAFFDGEGCVNVTKAVPPGKETNFHLQAVLVNTYLPVLNWYQERWGGKIYQAPRNRSILTDNPLGCWRLYWQGRAAGAVLRNWVPFLKVKREITENAIAFQALKERSQAAPGRATPPDLKAQQERFYLIHRSLSSRVQMTPEQTEALHSGDAPDDQLELLEASYFRD